jgi:hypothetical protein
MSSRATTTRAATTTLARALAQAALPAAVVLATSALTLTLALTAPPAGAASTTNAQSLYQAALKAAGSENVHFDSSATQDGVSIQVDGDTGTTSGAQTLTVTKGKTVEHVRALVVGPTGYIEGNPTALHDVIGLTTKQSRTYAGKWLSFPTSNTAMATLVQGLLDGQVPDELQMAGPFTYGPSTTVGGVHALDVRGYVSTDSGSKIHVALYLPPDGTPFPIEEVTNPGAKSSDIHGSVSFDKWGEKTTETAPSNAVSLLQLQPAQTSSATSTTTTTTTAP